MSHSDRKKSQIDGTLISIEDLLWIAKTSPNAPMDDAGNLPLHYAATYGSIDAIYDLLELGADASLENNAGRKPSELARDLGHIGAAIALRKAEIGDNNYRETKKVTSSISSKYSGEFVPTYKTNFIEDEEDWSVPGEIEEEEADREIKSPSLHSKRKMLSNILQSISVDQGDEFICFYERIFDVFRNINIVLRELKEINYEILSTQKESGSLLHGFGHMIYEVEKIICDNNEKSGGPQRAVDEILNLCYEYSDREDCSQQGIVDHNRIMTERIDFSNFIVSVVENFSTLVEGDLLNNFESGDQDLINARVKLVPPLYEGLKDLDRSDDCFQKEWSDILKSKSLWNREHWILPDD